MEFKKLKEFLADHRITRDELANTMHYSKGTMINILGRKGEAEGRLRMGFKVAVQEILEKRIKRAQEGLDEWDKMTKI